MWISSDGEEDAAVRQRPCNSNSARPLSYRESDKRFATVQLQLGQEDYAQVVQGKQRGSLKTPLSSFNCEDLARQNISCKQK